MVDAMDRIAPALLIAMTPHGETGGVLRAISATGGVVSAYVHGARGRRLRPVLQIGNRLALDMVERGDHRLPMATPHLLQANLAMLHGPAALAVVAHVTALLAGLLPEAVAQPRLFAMADALLTAAAAAVDRTALGAALVRFELELLRELGVGLDLGSCAATGARSDLAYVSPRSRQAVARGPGQPWAGRLLPLPAFLVSDATPSAGDVADGLSLTGHFINRDVLAGHPARQRLASARSHSFGLLTSPSAL